MTKIVRKIGAGKIATVSEGRTEVGKRVAIKQLNQQIQQNSPRRQRIFDAAASWASVEHPRLVSYQDLDQKHCWIVMELMECSAATKISQGAMAPTQALSVLRNCLLGLEHLHTRGGFLHANLKPTNVLFDGDDRASLSDGLGVALSAPGTLPAPTTRKYIAPEQANDLTGQIGPPIDLYCLGFVILELLAGNSFGGFFTGVGDQSHEDDLAWFQWHASNEKAPTARDVSSKCPTELAVVVDRLLFKNPHDRYQSARQALADLPESVTAATVERSPKAAKVENKAQALAGDVMQRPANGMLLHLISGPDAGRIVGSDDDEIRVGCESDCLLEFEANQCSDPTSKISIARTAMGWRAQKLAGQLLFVNNQELDESMAIRSGDIIRLSPRGPDFQFVLQSGGPTINDLAAKYLPQKKRAQPPARPGPVAALHPNAPNVNAPSPSVPNPNAPSGAAPQAPVPNQAAPGPAARASKPAAVSNAPARPANAPSRPTNAPQPPSSNASPQTSAPSAPASTSAANTARAPSASGESWLQPGSWSKNRKNLVVGIVSTIVAAIVLFLVPTGSEDKETPEEPAGAVQDTDQPNHVPLTGEAATTPDQE